MNLTKKDILQFSGAFPTLPKGSERYNYAMAFNFRRLLPTFQELSIELNPSPRYREYAAKLQADPNGSHDEYAEEIALHRQKVLDRPTILAETVEVTLRTVDYTDAPISELTPAQLAAIMPMINEKEEEV